MDFFFKTFACFSAEFHISADVFFPCGKVGHSSNNFSFLVFLHLYYSVLVSNLDSHEQGVFISLLPLLTIISVYNFGVSTCSAVNKIFVTPPPKISNTLHCFVPLSFFFQFVAVPTGHGPPRYMHPGAVCSSSNVKKVNYSLL